MASLLAAQGAQSGVDRGEDFGVRFGVELAVDVTHPGGVVDPVFDPVRPTLPFELAASRRRRRRAGAVAAGLFELFHRRAAGLVEQFGFVGDELGFRRLVEFGGGVGDCVEMSG